MATNRSRHFPLLHLLLRWCHHYYDYDDKYHRRFPSLHLTTRPIRSDPLPKLFEANAINELCWLSFHIQSSLNWVSCFNHRDDITTSADGIQSSGSRSSGGTATGHSANPEIVLHLIIRRIPINNTTITHIYICVCVYRFVPLCGQSSFVWNKLSLFGAKNTCRHRQTGWNEIEPNRPLRHNRQQLQHNPYITEFH